MLNNKRVVIPSDKVAATHPVVVLPIHQCRVLDLTSEHVTLPPNTWAFGRYDEKRPDTYKQALFGESEGTRRDIHVGVDIFAPTYTAVHAFTRGIVIHSGVNVAPGDYGPVLVVLHELSDDGQVIYALYGHLSTASVELSPVGRHVQGGDVLGWIGTPTENGGWDPHVHFQLAWERPQTHDLPGVVSERDRLSALRQFPDPTHLVLSHYPSLLLSPLLSRL